MKLTLEQKQEIIETVAMSFETGHTAFESKEDFKRDFEYDSKVVDAAWDYYCELVNMGPAGFYEEFKDKYDFDPMFVSEYGDADYEEEIFIDRAYHDASEEELRAMGCLGDEEEDIEYYTIPIDPSLKEEALRLLYSEEE